MAHPAERGHEVAAGGHEDAHEAAVSAPVDVVSRTAVVPEHDAARPGDRRDRARETARVRSGEQIDLFALEELGHPAPRDGRVAAIVAHDELDLAARAASLCPQRQPPPRVDAHRRERAGERDHEAHPERS